MNIITKKEQAFAEIEKFKIIDESSKNYLEEFVDLLIEENKKVNLIGKSTTEDIWNRHIVDSIQLFKFIKSENHKFADLGCGAGLPGLVLSIAGIKEIHLIEKSFRKCEFLRLARKISKNKITVHNRKIEEINQFPFDCIISRALASLEKLLEYSLKLLNKDGYCLFLKGKNFESELQDAKKIFNFDYILHQSITSNVSYIVEISNITSKNPAPNPLSP